MGQPAKTADEEFGNPIPVLDDGDATVATDEAVENTDDEQELDEVDVADVEDEAEEVDEVEKPTKTGAKKVAKKAAKSRPAVPDGYIAPVAFAKKLTAKLVAAGTIAEDEEIPPQMIYSYIKNTAKGKDPLPSYSAGGRDNLLKEDEAFAWWDRKEARAAERAATKGKKVAKKEAGEVEEAEGTETTAEVEEAE